MVLRRNKTHLTESRSLEATPFLLHRADTHILLIPTLAGWGVVLGDKNKPGLSLVIPKQKKSHAVASFWFEYHISELHDKSLLEQVQWKLSKTDTVGNQNFVRNSEVPLTQGLPVGVACVIGLLSTM